jgi:type IV secretory pathway VirD2 relaxase
MFDAASDDADLRAFAERASDDRHHFRFIVSPEDATEMEDLRAFTRDLTKQMEHDLGTRLDWVGIDHWNTDNPHVHLIVRGADDRGDTLVIHRNYISHGMRERAGELVTIELGPQSEHEVRRKLAGEVGADRWTRLDAALLREAQRTEDGVLDFRPEVARSARSATRSAPC